MLAGNGDTGFGVLAFSLGVVRDKQVGNEKDRTSAAEKTRSTIEKLRTELRNLACAQAHAQLTRRTRTHNYPRRYTHMHAHAQSQAHAQLTRRTRTRNY